MSITANTPTFTASPLGNYQIVSAQYQSTDTTRIYPSLWREVRSYRNNKLLSKKRIRNWGSTATTNQITRTYNDYNGRKDGSTDGTYCQYRLIVYSNSARTKVAKQSSLSSALYSPPAAPADGDLSAAITTTSLTAKWANPNMGSNASKTDAFATVTLYDADGTQVDTYTSSDYTERSHTFTGLTANTEYYFTIQYSVSSIGSSRVARSKMYITTPLAPLQPTGISCGIVGGGRELPAVGTGSVYCTWQYNSADGSPQTGASGTTQAGAWSVADDTNYLTFPVSSGGVIDPSYLTPRVDGSGYDFTFTLSDVSSAGGTTAVGTTVTLFIPNTLTVTDTTDPAPTDMPLYFTVTADYYEYVSMAVDITRNGETVYSQSPETVRGELSGGVYVYSLGLSADVFVPNSAASYGYTITIVTPYGQTAEVSGTFTPAFTKPGAPTVTAAENGDYTAAVTVTAASDRATVSTDSGSITLEEPDGGWVRVKAVPGFSLISGTIDDPEDFDDYDVTGLKCGIDGGTDITTSFHSASLHRLGSFADYGYIEYNNSASYFEGYSVEVGILDLSDYDGITFQGAVTAGGEVATSVYLRFNPTSITLPFYSAQSAGDQNEACTHFPVIARGDTYPPMNYIGDVSWYGGDMNGDYPNALYVLIRFPLDMFRNMTEQDVEDWIAANKPKIAYGIGIGYDEYELVSGSMALLDSSTTFDYTVLGYSAGAVVTLDYYANVSASLSVYRVDDNGLSLITDGLIDGATAIDNTPPLNVSTQYVAVAVSASGIPSDTSQPATVTVMGSNALVNYGDERQLLIEGTYDPAYSGSYDYDTAQVHYAGDEYPTGYDSGQRDQDSTLAFVAIEDSVEDMPDYGADAVYRDPTGARYDVQILSITDNYDSDRPGRRSSQIKMKRVNDAR